MKVYQAGGMTKVPRFGVDEARKVTAFLRSMHWEVTSPWERDEEKFGDFWDLWPAPPLGCTLETCLRDDFKVICDQDAIVLMDTWADSPGVQKELRVANDIGLEVWRITKTGLDPSGYRMYQVEQDGITPTGPEAYTTGNAWDQVAGVEMGPIVVEDLQTGEVRITDPNTGGQKGSKHCRTDLLPQDALLELANHFGRGTAKYEARNWERGYPWHLSYAALLRHLLAWWDGQELDEEGFPHVTAAVWHAVVLLAFSLRGAGIDDRPSAQPPG